MRIFETQKNEDELSNIQLESQMKVSDVINDVINLTTSQLIEYETRIGKFGRNIKRIEERSRDERNGNKHVKR